MNILIKKICVTSLPMLLLAGWFFGMAFGLDVAFRKFEANTTSTPPSIHADEGWRNKRFFVEPDSYSWLAYARDLRENGQWRMRYTFADNAPYGREMHWSHLPIWGVMALSVTLERLGMSSPLALEWAGRLLMPLLGFLSFSLLYGFLKNRCGWTFSLLLSLASAVLLFWEFHPLRPDHHGFQIVFSFFFWLFLLFSGFGWTSMNTRPPVKFFILSGMMGGLALWLGATVFYFSLGSATLAILCLTWCKRTPQEKREFQFHPLVWRYWAWTGAVTALLFYGLEYAPHSFSFRLEVNHPLYALSWLGIGELLFLYMRWRCGKHRITTAICMHGILAFTAMCALPLLVLWGPPSFYWPRIATMWQLHAHHIHEFLSPIHNAQNMQEPFIWNVSPYVLPGIVAALLSLFWLKSRMLPLYARHMILFGCVIFLGFIALFFWQTRWRSFSAAAGLLFSIGAVFCACRYLPRHSLRMKCILFGALSVSLGISLWTNVYSVWATWSVSKIDPSYFKAFQQRYFLLNLRNHLPEERSAFFMPLELAPAAYYFGTGRSVGSLYWENQKGLQATVDFYGDTLPGTNAVDIAKSRNIHYVLMPEGAQDALSFYQMKTERWDHLGASKTVGGALTGVGTAIPEWIIWNPTWNKQINPTLYTFVPRIQKWVPTQYSMHIYGIQNLTD